MENNNGKIFPQYSISSDDKLKEIYGHGDCAAFADILHWDFKNKGFNSKVIMAGTRLANHFYIKLENNNREIAYCDIYGVFKKEQDILDRYNLTKEEVYEVNNPEENKLFQTLIESSYLFEDLEDSEDKQEDFFLEMQKILLQWEESLIELPVKKKQSTKKKIHKYTKIDNNLT